MKTLTANNFKQEKPIVDKPCFFLGDRQQRIHSTNAALDHFLEGQLRQRQVSEWGVPWGKGGREVLLTFLSEQRFIWISRADGLQVYPPAWQARGIKLEDAHFATTDDFIQDLKPIFLEPFFKVVVVDSPKNLTHQDLAFLARQARCNEQAIIVLRSYFLTPERGNVWARLRLNCWRRARGEFCMQVVKGLSWREIFFDL